MKIKDRVKTLQNSRFWAGRAIYKIVKQGLHLARLLTGGVYRSEYITKWKHGGLYYQRPVYTVPNRYPLLFAQCQKYLGNVESPYILSFGCSTGEEVSTLGEYLPYASITGVDINEWCIKQCKKKNIGARFSFHHRFSKEFAGAGDFDAIFCMAVFQRTENRAQPTGTAQEFTFEHFEQEILMLDKKLKPGGLFTIDNADFSFTDTVCSAHYQPLYFEKNKLLRERPLFDRDNKKIAETQFNYRMFVKQIT